jgi:hypothetical protein
VLQGGQSRSRASLHTQVHALTLIFTTLSLLLSLSRASTRTDGQVDFGVLDLEYPEFVELLCLVAYVASAAAEASSPASLANSPGVVAKLCALIGDTRQRGAPWEALAEGSRLLKAAGEETRSW